MRRITVMVTAMVLLTGCGGTGLIGGEDLERQQDIVDDVARFVVSTLVSGLDGGDPDQASYFVDTFITYDVLPPARAAAQVADALRSAGLEVTVDPKTQGVSTAKGDVTVDLSTQDKGGGSAGQNIYVSTACLTVGEKQISDSNAANGCDVTP